MNTASLSDIKKQLAQLPKPALEALCLRLGRYKKENKELLDYLLFESDNEEYYVEQVKEEINDAFSALPAANAYLTRKVLRKILRNANKRIRYSGLGPTELVVRIHFCARMKELKLHTVPGTVLFNLYEQQLKKIAKCFGSLDEDLQADYQRDLASLRR